MQVNTVKNLKYLWLSMQMNTIKNCKYLFFLENCVQIVCKNYTSAILLQNLLWISVINNTKTKEYWKVSQTSVISCHRNNEAISFEEAGIARSGEKTDTGSSLPIELSESTFVTYIIYSGVTEMKQAILSVKILKR